MTPCGVEACRSSVASQQTFILFSFLRNPREGCTHHYPPQPLGPNFVIVPICVFDGCFVVAMCVCVCISCFCCLWNLDFYRFNIYLDIVVVSLFAFVANLFVGAIHVSCFIVCCCLHYLSLRFVLFWYLRFSCDYYLSAFFAIYGFI